MKEKVVRHGLSNLAASWIVVSIVLVLAASAGNAMALSDEAPLPQVQEMLEGQEVPGDGAGPAAMKNGRCGACAQSAKDAYFAGYHEIRDDYWLSIGKCRNLADPQECTGCMREARAELFKSKKLLAEQFRARRKLCRVLGQAPYDPVIRPENFVDFEAVIEGSQPFEPNPYLLLVPGFVRRYVVKDSDGAVMEKIEVEVLNDTKEILGVNCIVIHDRVWEIDDDGKDVMIEDTYDWLGQDVMGNVWYFGEIVKNFEEGELADLDGSWVAGREMAKPGILMPAQPMQGEVYRQEFLLGEAEDVAAIEDFVDEHTVAGNTYYNVLKTKDFTPMEPGVLEYKYYAPGIGLVMEEKPASGERQELIEVIFP